MLDSMRIGSLMPVSLGNGKFIGNLFSFASVTLYRKIIILFYFPIGLVYMVLFGKASGFFDFYAYFCIFLCIFSYLYAFIFIFMHCYAFLLL